MAASFFKTHVSDFEFPTRVCLIFLRYVIDVMQCHGAEGPIIIFHWFFYYLRVSTGNKNKVSNLLLTFGLRRSSMKGLSVF